MFLLLRSVTHPLLRATTNGHIQSEMALPLPIQTAFDNDLMNPCRFRSCHTHT